MLKNHLITGLRNLFKHKGYALINVVALALGMACCLIILLWVIDELGYDRFHRNAERIYRVALKARINDKDLISAYSPAPMARTLVADFPEVEHSTTLYQTESATVRQGEKILYERKFFYADPGFFKVFTFPYAHCVRQLHELGDGAIGWTCA